jgi:hypothetical protein
MKASNISDLLSCDINLDEWSDFDDTIKTLTWTLGGSYKIRLLGKAYKATRCFVSEHNKICNTLHVQDFKNILNGNSIRFNERDKYHYPDDYQQLMHANSKSSWSKCLVATVILISNNKKYENNQLYCIALDAPIISQLINLAKSDQFNGACLSGIRGRNIAVNMIDRIESGNRRNVRFGNLEVSIDSQDTFLSKKAVALIANSGINDAKEHFIESNKINVHKKCGYFYSFPSKEKSSILDKHLEPFTKVKNFIEEDEQHDYIMNDRNKVLELEGIEPFSIMEIT